jgi:hypothetical protein
LLLKECPQDFVTYFSPGARFVRMRETQFQTREEGSLDSREIRGDSMLEAEHSGKPFLIGVEWQTTKDSEMHVRLLDYNCESTRLHNLTVLSCVIYIKRAHEPPRPPLERVLPDNSPIMWFDYRNLELAEKTVEEFRQLNLDGFRPLMLFCKDGQTLEVLEEVLTYLERKKKGVLVSLTQCFATMVFTSQEEKAWLRRRFAMQEEFLLENSWIYQEYIAKGAEQGLERGKVQAVQQNIEMTIETRFPKLLSSVKGRIESLTDLTKLQELFMTALTAPTQEAVERSLRARS